MARKQVKKDAGLPLFDGLPVEVKRADRDVSHSPYERDETIFMSLTGVLGECNPPHTPCVIDDGDYCWSHGIQQSRERLEEEVEG